MIPTPNVYNFFRLLKWSILSIFIGWIPIKGFGVDPFTQITDDEAVQLSPAMWENFIVYVVEGNAGADIYLHNLLNSTETNITNDINTPRSNVDIYENLVVWQEQVGSDWELYWYNIHTPAIAPKALIEWEGDQIEPAIYDDYLVFTDKKPGVTSYNIWMFQFSISTLTRLTDDTDGDQRDLDIYENLIVWQDQRMGNWDIYMYDIARDEFRIITDDESDQVHPAVHDRRIVWEDFRDGNANIYMHHTTYGLGTVYEDYDWPVLLGNTHPYQDPDSQRYPQIYGDNLVFADFRNGNWDIYLYKYFNPIVGSLYRVTSEDQDQEFPVVYENLVVWQDERRWDGVGPYATDIWMWEILPGADVGVLVEDIPDPAEVGSELHYNVYIYNNGPLDAPNVSVVSTLPDESEFVVVYNNSGLGCSRVGQEVTCELGDLVEGQHDTVEIVVRLPEEGELQMLATVTSDEQDQYSDNDYYYAYTTVQWQIPEEIGDGYNPSFELDQNNQIHLCYLEELWEPTDLKYAKNSGGGWSMQVLDSSVIEAQLTLDQWDSVHIAYVIFNEQSFQYSLHYLKGKDGFWHPSKRISTNYSHEIVRLDIETSSDGDPYISCLFTLWGGWDSDIKLFYQRDGAWYGPAFYNDYNVYNDLAMAMDDNGHLHFAFYQVGVVPGGLYYLTNAPDSVWKSAEFVQSDWTGSQLESLFLDIEVDPDNSPHISYCGSHESDMAENFKYAYKSGSVWFNELVESHAMGYFNTLTIDPASKAHLLLNNMEDSELHYADNISGAWNLRTIDFSPDEVADIEIDELNYAHIIYGENGTLKYVTDTPPKTEPQIMVSPATIDFIGYVVGDTTNPRDVTIKNTGEADLELTDIRLAWPDSSHFSIVNNDCSVLAAGSSCTVQVAFNPQNMGNKTALLWIESNDPDDPESSVTLKGEGLEPILWVDGNVQFGEVEIGDSITHYFYLKNEGNYQMSLQLVTIEQYDAESFYISGVPPTPFTIEEDDSVQFMVVFKAAVPAGDKTTLLKVFSTGGDFNTVLEGTALPTTFQISGMVLTPDSDPVDVCRVWLFEKAAEHEFHTVSHQDLSETAFYTFSGLETDYYTLLAEPDPESYAGYVPTFLGEALIPEDAEIITLTSDQTDKDIILAEDPGDGSGSAIIEGAFFDVSDLGGGRIYLTQQIVEEGIPVENVPLMVMEQTSGDLKSFEHSGQGGAFTFDQLEVGVYTLYANYNGLPMDSNNEDIVIGEVGEEVTIMVTANTSTIQVEIQQITNLSDRNNEVKIVVYPNPAHNRLKIEVNRLSATSTYRLIIYDLSGKIKLDEQFASTGNNEQLDVDISHMTAGVYLLVIEGEGVNFRQKWFKRGP